LSLAAAAWAAPTTAAPDSNQRWGWPPVSERAVLRPPTWQLPAANRTKPRPGLPGDPKVARKSAAADTTPVIPSGPLHIVVSIANQRATLFADGQPVAHSAVSTGTPDHPTPVGVFSVIQKHKDHYSNIYGAAMPYMQRITWSGSALHEGPLPGRPASHGCIRLTPRFAQLLWKVTKIGARVIVTRDEVVPVEIDMVNPFAPKPGMVAATVPTTPIKTADATGAMPITTAAAKIVELKTHAVPVVAEPAENQSAPEQATKSEPIADGTSASDAKPVTARAVETQTATSKTAADQIPMIERAPVNFDGIGPTEPQAKPVMVERLTEPVPMPVRAPGWREAKRSSEPVSVFISRKEAKLYVRLKMEPLFDAPVAFERPDQPIGTHVFTAMAAKGDDGGMRWTAITIPSGFKRATDKPKADGRNRRPENSARPALEPPTEPLPSPRGVFDRIVMPPELVERIAALFIPGSSIIVSDNRLSDETGEYTEFIVLTP
jgi:lipoprotein-anchoring transpeptidase ErfK/SrfK